MSGIRIFDQYSEEYDRWFDRNESVYRAEIAALERLTPAVGRGLEIGVGTGRFAAPLGIQFGADPAMNMVRRAAHRGIRVCVARGEQLPFPGAAFDYAVLITVDCFVEDLRALLREAGRVIRPHGHIIIGHIDRHSPLGRMYESRKEADRFYREAHFRAVDEITGHLHHAGFERMQFCQTILGIPGETPGVTRLLDGHGAGVFVVIKAEKIADER